MSFLRPRGRAYAAVPTSATTDPRPVELARQGARHDRLEVPALAALPTAIDLAKNDAIVRALRLRDRVVTEQILHGEPSSAHTEELPLRRGELLIVEHSL